MTDSQKPTGREPTDDEIRIALEKTKWGKTYLTNFLHSADRNTRITYLKLMGYFEMLESVGDIFKAALDNVGYLDGSSGVIALLLGGACRNYLAAVRLSSSGQLTESYAQLRACIEDALYAFNIYRAPELARTWLDRHKGEKSRKDSLNSFKPGTILNELTLTNQSLGKNIKREYENCIDYGAHPNERSVTPNLTFTGSGISVALLNTTEGIFQACLLTCVRCGVEAIEVFKMIYPDDFKKFNVEQRIEAIHKQYSRISPEIRYKLGIPST